MSDLVQQLREPWAGPRRLDLEVQKLYDMCLQAASALEAKDAEIERLRKDAERLDFIEKRARCDPKMDGQHVWWPTNFNHRLAGPTLRAAIDSAMQSAKE